jgi:hypothetical protein
MTDAVIDPASRQCHKFFFRKSLGLSLDLAREIRSIQSIHPRK